MPEHKSTESTEEESGLKPSGDVHSAEAGGDAADATSSSLEDLDLEDLDLTVETVEERISPSETNVFDK